MFSKVLDLPASVVATNPSPSEQPASAYKAAVGHFVETDGSNFPTPQEPKKMLLPHVQESHTLQQLLGSVKTLTAREELLNTLRSGIKDSLQLFVMLLLLRDVPSCHLQSGGNDSLIPDCVVFLKGSICWCTQLVQRATVNWCWETAAPDWLLNFSPVYHWAEERSWPRTRCVYLVTSCIKDQVVLPHLKFELKQICS